MHRVACFISSRKPIYDVTLVLCQGISTFIIPEISRNGFAFDYVYFYAKYYISL